MPTKCTTSKKTQKKNKSTQQALRAPPVQSHLGEPRRPRRRRDARAEGRQRRPLGDKRFTDALLPALKGKASDVVIELWVGNPACAKKVAQVQKQQKDVTANQAPTNQNEFMVLGDVAKKLGVFPHALVPGCDEYERILDAGGGDVDAMLSMFARLTTRDSPSSSTRTRGASPTAGTTA